MKLADLKFHEVSDGQLFLDGGVIGSIPEVLWEKKIVPDVRNRTRLGHSCSHRKWMKAGF